LPEGSLELLAILIGRRDGQERIDGRVEYLLHARIERARHAVMHPHAIAPGSHQTRSP
jgi:hypothetical protein